MNVSILVPIYLVERYIKRCAISLFEQTYNNIEYIFVDDCTPDKSIEILNDIINKYPYRKQNIKIIHNNINLGIAAVRNICIKNASGDFVIFVDSDDYLEKDAVEKLVVQQLNSNSDIVSGQVVEHRNNCHFIIPRPQFKTKEDFVKDMLQLTINHALWGRLIRLSLFKKHSIKAIEGVNVGEDMEMMSLLSYYADRCTSIYDVIYHYDTTNQNSYMNSLSFNKNYRTKYLKRILQDIESVKFVYDFFYKEDQKYLSLIKENLRLLYSRLRIEYCILDDKENYYLITYKLSELNENIHGSFISKIKENFYVYKILTKFRNNIVI